MYRVHTLPTKPAKDADVEETSREGGRSALRSVEDSLVLLQSLRQSRQTWLTSAFVKFSTKSRGGKGSEIWQPPHSIRFRGKCDLEIGPHVFYATSIYEVTYQPYQAPVQAPSPYYLPPGQKAPAWPPASYSYSSIPQAPAAPVHTTGAPVYAPSATALVSSLKGAVPITNDLIAQVNTAAVSNPTLANLLGLAASGTATPEQLQTLGVTIQSLAETALKSAGSSAQIQSSSAAAPATASQTSAPPPTYKSSQATPAPVAPPQPPVLSLRPPQTPTSLPTSQAPPPHTPQPIQTQTIHKEPDVVIEFYENSYDRWVLPKDLVLYERVKRWDGNNSLADIIFSAIFPFEGSKPNSVPSVQASPNVAAEPPQPNKDTIHPITLRFFNVPPAIWNLFSNAAGDEERTKRVQAAVDAQLDKAAPRAYLQYRISEGALLTQLQASASDRYPTKLIRPAAPAAGTTQTKRRAPVAAKNTKEGSPAGAPPPKRKRTTPAKKPEPRTGKCEGCLRIPVLLVPDAPYCPTCDKAKKANVKPAVPPTGANTSAPQGTTSPATPNKKPRQPAAPPPFTHAPQYATAGRPLVQNYYAWQARTPYTYQQYQPQPLPQPGQTQISQAMPAQPSHTQPSSAPATSPRQSESTQPVPKKSDLAAMD